jgi:stage II sporulation protein D
MNMLRILALCALFFSSNLSAKEPLIRVLLDTVVSKKSSSFEYSLSSDKGFFLYTDHDLSTKIFINDPTIKIRLISGAFYVSSESLSQKKVKSRTITFIPREDNFTVNGSEFSGTLTFHNHLLRATPMLINTVPLETYLYSVLRYELYQHWPKEVHKVQAIVSRSYALHHMINARKQAQIYDVRNSNVHQTYHGHHEFEHLKEVIEETRGLTLTYKSKPILAMFDSCCGGITPAHVSGQIINLKKAPYLARTRPCTFCLSSGLARWNFSLSPGKVREYFMCHKGMRSVLKNVGTIQTMRIEQSDKAGLARKIVIEGTRGDATVSAKMFWESLRPRVRSLAFNIRTVTHRNNMTSFGFSGRGFGHQIGLCQQGAHALVKHGWRYEEILKFYYPKTKLARLEVQKKE